MSTRWLSLQKCLERSLSLWDGLKSYFLTYFDDEDDELPRKRQVNAGPREKRLVSIFKDTTKQLYIHFLNAIMPNFDAFNVLLQTEAPMIHRLYPSMLKLYKVQYSILLYDSIYVFFLC